jgi:hypothetical protein
MSRALKLCAAHGMRTKPVLTSRKHALQPLKIGQPGGFYTGTVNAY